MYNAKKRLLLGAIALLIAALAANPGSMTSKTTGWVAENGQLHFYNDDGRMVTGWLCRDDGTYYLLPDGTRATGWQQIEGKNYLFTDEGILCTGWQETETGRLLLGSDGAQAFGLTQYRGRLYYLDDNGLMVTGWLTLEDDTYYMDAAGAAVTGLAEIDGVTYAFRENGTLASGWYSWEDKTYRISEDGTPLTGWQVIDEKTYYLDTDGSLYTGFLEYDGHTYYLRSGEYATGIVSVDGRSYYFDSRGWNLLMVNPWNEVPEGYEVELVSVGDGHYLAQETASDFSAMMDALQQAGLEPIITSSYRTTAKQESLFNNKVDYYLKQGYSEEDARATAGTAVAVPGTSEHQLGLAVDLTDANYRILDEGQEETATQQWLIANSWKFGFILRYPNGKSAITGIIYEPWHYRYVGRTLAAELHELDLTLEEYLDMLTEDDTLTASNPKNLTTAASE